MRVELEVAWSTLGHASSVGVCPTCLRWSVGDELAMRQRVDVVSTESEFPMHLQFIQPWTFPSRRSFHQMCAIDH